MNKPKLRELLTDETCGAIVKTYITENLFHETLPTIVFSSSTYIRDTYVKPLHEALEIAVETLQRIKGPYAVCVEECSDCTDKQMAKEALAKIRALGVMEEK